MHCEWVIWRWLVGHARTDAVRDRRGGRGREYARGALQGKEVWVMGAMDEDWEVRLRPGNSESADDKDVM
jgi:hypothetical protein